MMKHLPLQSFQFSHASGRELAFNHSTESPLHFSGHEVHQLTILM